MTDGDRADAEQQMRRGSRTGQLESVKANGVGKEGLEGGYICLDDVCIFFFPPKTESALDITNGAWVVSAALAPTPISHAVPAVRQHQEHAWEALLCSSSFGEAGEERTRAESCLGKQLQGCPPGATRHTATSS